MLATDCPFGQFFDLDGSPLAAGSIYFGTAGLNPVTNPIPIYWDLAGTQPAAQPVKTLNGYPVRGSTPTLVYVGGNYSMLVLNKKGQQVFYLDDASGLPSGFPIRLAEPDGATDVGFDVTDDYDGITGAPTNIAQAMQEVIGDKSFSLYVSTTGSDANDGSISHPFATVQKAWDTLALLGTIGGKRHVSIAAGTYTETIVLGAEPAVETVPNTNYETGGVQSANFIIIEGPDVGYDPGSSSRPVPTAVFDGGGSGTGFQGYNVRVLVKNIKVKNYATGMVFVGGHIRLENCHGNDCTAYGFSGNYCRFEMKGGLADGCDVGLRLIFNTKNEIGYQGAGAVGQGPLLSNNRLGALLQEGATGHFDWVEFADNDEAIRLIKAHVNYSGCDFKRNDLCFRGDTGSSWFANPGTANFHFGTADANGELWIPQSFSYDQNRDPYAHSGLATHYNAAFDLTNTPTSAPIITKTLPRGAYAPVLSSIRKPQHITGTGYGTFTGVADTKLVKLRLGATILASVTIPAAYAGPWSAVYKIVFTAYNVQSAMLEVKLHGPTAAGAGAQNVYLSVDSVGSEDLSAGAVDLILEAQLGSAVADHVICPTGAAHMESWG